MSLARAAGLELSSFEVGQVVRGLDSSAWRVASKVSGPGGVAVKLATLSGEHAQLPADFIAVSPRMAHFAAMMRYHLAYNKDFDLYVRAYCEQAGLPVPVGPDGQPFRWADWFQSKIVPKLYPPLHEGMDTKAVDAIKDEAIHEMLFVVLGHRRVLDKFKKQMKRFHKDIRSLPVANQLTVYLTKNFMWRVQEMSRKIKEQFGGEIDLPEGAEPEEKEPGEKLAPRWVSLYQPGGEGDEEEVSVLDTEEHAHTPAEFGTAESEHDIQRFRSGFYAWLKKHQTQQSAERFISLFDIYWEWISEAGDFEDPETGRPSYMPKRRELEAPWREETGLSSASLYEHLGRFARLLEQYVRDERQTLGEGNIFVKLIDSIHQQREDLRKKPSRTPARAASLLADIVAAPQAAEDIYPPEGEPYCDSCDRLGKNCVCEQPHAHHAAGAKTAKLVRGDELTPEMRKQVLDSFVYRWTRENPHRTRVYECSACDLNEPYANESSAEGHTHPTIPLKSDDEWVREHAFHFTNDGRLIVRRSAEPADLAGPAANPVLSRAGAIEDDPNACDTCGAEMEEGHCPRCMRKVQHGLRFDQRVEKEFQSGVPRKEKKTAEFGENVERKLFGEDWAEEELPGVKMDREHPRCPECGECVVCNLRPCRGGGQHARASDEGRGALREAAANLLEARAEGLIAGDDWHILEDAVKQSGGSPLRDAAVRMLTLNWNYQTPTDEDWAILERASRQGAKEAGIGHEFYEGVRPQTVADTGHPLHSSDSTELTENRVAGGEAGRVFVRFEGAEQEFDSVEEALHHAVALSAENPGKTAYFVIDEEGVVTEDAFVGGRHVGETRETLKAASLSFQEYGHGIPSRFSPELQGRLERSSYSCPKCGEGMMKDKLDSRYYLCFDCGIAWEALYDEPLFDKIGQGPISPQEMSLTNVENAQGSVYKPPQPARVGGPAGRPPASIMEKPAEKDIVTAPGDVTPETMAVEAAGPATPAALMQRNIQRSQGIEEPAGAQPPPAQQPLRPGTSVAITPESGYADEDAEPMRKTILPELENAQYHMSSRHTADDSALFVDRGRWFEAIRKRGSTGQECQFVEWKPGQWYYLLEDRFDAEEGYEAWDWRENAMAYGPFKTEDEANEHLHGHHANPGGANIIPNSDVDPGDKVLAKLVAEAPKNMRHFAASQKD